MRARLFNATLYLVFFLSGFAALIYQVVWQRAFTLYYGVGAVSTTIVVSVFLFGLGAGAYLGGALAERAGRRRLLVYIALEAALGVMGVASLHVLKAMTPYLSQAGYTTGFLIIAALIALPTLVMGMTLPIVVKIMNGSRNDFGQTLSRLYCVNTLGAAIGALLAAYWFISFFGMQMAVYIAGGINVAVAGMVYGLSRFAPPESVHTDGQAIAGVFSAAQAAAIVFVTGFLAIGYQILWFRLIGTLLKPSAYVFSSVLFVYLTGIALGSYLAGRWLYAKVRAAADLKNAFFVINAGIAVYIIATFLVFYAWDNPVSSWMIGTSFAEQLHPPYNTTYAISHDSVAAYWKSVYLLFDIFIWPILLLWPACVLMGASFPLMNVLVIQNKTREGYATGLVYALTVIGNVAGGLLTGFVLLPRIGTELTLVLFVSAGLMWILGTRYRLRLLVFVGLMVAMAGIMPGRAGFYDHIHPQSEGLRVITEGRDGVVATFPKDDRVTVFISGSEHAAFPSAAYDLEVMEAITHAPSVENALVIGLGGGGITNALMRLKEVKSITVVEIAETLPDNLRRHPEYKPMFSDPRVHIIIDDGRRYLQRNPGLFDVVFMDPLQSTTVYSNNIYSAEFFTLVREHLKPKGVFMTWMNEYSVIPHTLASVYPQMKCFFYFCLSSQEALVYNTARRNRFLAATPAFLRHNMRERMDVPYYMTGDRDKMMSLTKAYPINTDFNPVTEYYFGYTHRRF